MLSTKNFKAPKGMYRVIGVDTFENPPSDWISGDFKTKEEALAHARKEGGTMCMMHVYDDKGNHVGEAGQF